MSEFPNIDTLFPENDPNFKQSDARPLMAQWEEATLQLPGARPTATFTIADGILTPTRSACRVDTEGQAPADELELIASTGIHNGAEITLLAADAAREVTVKHNPGVVNGIALAGGADKKLSATGYLRLKCENDRWVECVSAGVELPIATPAGLGGIKPDNVTLKVDSNGVASAQGGMPSGAICLWSGAQNAVPSGWAFCDGQNGTPDLRGRFIMGSGGNKAVGAEGGTSAINATVADTTLTSAQIPSHRHSSYGNYIGSAGAGTGGTDFVRQSAATNTGNTGGGGSHTHALTSAAESNLPPYYVLAYIMKL